MWTKATVLGGVAALALVAGGAGMAIASAQGTARPEVATAAPAGDPTPTISPSANGAKAAKADRDGLKQILGKLKDFQHAEWVTKGDGNAYVTHEALLGQIQAVSSTSITVTSSDGTSMTFAVNDQTKIRQRKAQGTATPAIADLKTGQTVLVGGQKSPDLTAMNILIPAS
jgi:Domain of unknown function (DUF5666)